VDLYVFELGPHHLFPTDVVEDQEHRSGGSLPELRGKRFLPGFFRYEEELQVPVPSGELLREGYRAAPWTFPETLPLGLKDGPLN
jgi:hypothetical protein